MWVLHMAILVLLERILRLEDLHAVIIANLENIPLKSELSLQLLALHAILELTLAFQEALLVLSV